MARYEVWLERSATLYAIALVEAENNEDAKGNALVEAESLRWTVDQSDWTLPFVVSGKVL